MHIFATFLFGVSVKLITFAVKEYKRPTMKQRALLFVFLLLLTLTASARVKVNGVYYNFDDVSKQASVTSGGYSGSVTIPSSVVYNGATYDVTSIGSGAFSGYGGLSSVSIPNSVTSIGDYAFNGCKILTSLIIPDNVKSIGNSAFSGCTTLASINIPEGVTSIGSNTFYLCSSLTEIVIPSSVTSIGTMAFFGCSNLSSIEIPSSVTFIDSDAFYGTAWYDNQPDGLIYVGDVAYRYKGEMPENTSVTIKDGTLSISGNAFNMCAGMNSILIPNSVTSIGNTAFSGCSGLTSIIIHSDMTSIGKNAYNNCPNLSRVTINSNSVLEAGYSQSTSLKHYFGNQVSEYILGDEITSIGDYAFNSCTGIKSVTVGNGVKTIGNYAFANFPELTDFYCYAEQVPTTSRNTFQDSYIDFATLHVPYASINNYKSDAIWGKFGSIVAIKGTEPDKKCATPTISFADGKLKFNCETEGVELHYEYSIANGIKGVGDEAAVPQILIVNVYATKEGYEDSEVATKEINLRGDVNTDGKVNGTDIQEVINIIVDGQ